MIDTLQLRGLIIIPVLRHIDLYSESAVNLLLGTAAIESGMGMYLKQINGPPLGIYQMEPNTHLCIWTNFLVYRPILKSKIEQYIAPHFAIGHEQLIWNLAYATAMARIKYLRSPRELPDKNDIDGLASTWRFDYNSQEGAFDNITAIEKFKIAYNKYVTPYVNQQNTN